jgi:histidyl-tRNA synthetase
VVEAELLSIAADCLEGLGFAQFELRINHRGLLRALIETCGIPPARESDAITAIDKLDKLGLEGVRAELSERGVEAGPAARLLDLLGERADFEHIERGLAEHAAGAQAMRELREVMRLAQKTGAGAHLRFDITLARGLGYYTGAIYEIAVPDLGSSMAAGGRYDGLIGMFLGRDVPACGLSLGFERILVVMAEREMYPADLQTVDVLLAAAREQDLELAFELSHDLRKRGLRVDLSPRAENPGKLRKRAEADGIASVVWIDRERTEGASLWLRANGQSQARLDADAITRLIEAASTEQTA